MSRRTSRRRNQRRNELQEAALLDAILDRLAPIPGHLLRRYHRIAPNVPWSDTAEALRRELRNGHVIRERWEGCSYVTVVVQGRFRLDLEHEVGSAQLVAVDLRPATTRSRKAA